MRMNLIFFKKQRGMAAVITTVLVLALCLLVALAMGLLILNEQKISRNFLKSSQAYFSAESGVEDSLYRVIKNKNYLASNSLNMADGVATINISGSDTQKTIIVNGEEDNRFRKVQVILNTSTDAVSFYYGVQVGEGGITMSNNSTIQGSVYSNGDIQGANGASITGDAWVADRPANVDQQSTSNDSDFIFGRTSPMLDTAQSFIPSTSDYLTKVTLYLKKTGSPSDTTVRILTDNGGSPSKNLVASGAYGTLIASQISQTSYSWIDVNFNTPPLLQAGVKYWIVVDTSADSNKYFWWGKDSTDAYSGGTGKYSANWNASSPVWSSASGDLAFKAWIGGLPNSLNNLQIGANAHANTINSCNITGNAYYQTISGSTVNGTSYPGSPDPGPENLPISQANIDDWKADAAAGGVINADLTLSSTTNSLGPKKINGNLTVTNNADLTITGTVYVTGNINISNNAKVRLAAGYGGFSGIVLSDGSISVSNNAVFYGSGAGSYIMFLSTKTGSAINVSNNSNTVIFYAANGTVNIANNAVLKEVTAYGINISNNAQVIYETGLASAKFSSGTGGGWVVASWQEVQ